MTPLSYLAASATLLGIVSHLFVFRKHEPNVLHFLGSISLSGAVITLYLLCNTTENNGILIILSTSAIQLSYVTGLVVSLLAYRLSPWHPLAKYPGPLLARMSKWYMAYWIARGNRHLVLQRLHTQHGPWLRIGPNEISVNMTSAIRPIYTSMFRAPSYRGAPGDADALVTTNDRSEHSRRVVAWNKAFSDGTKQFGSFARERTYQLLEIIRTHENEPINLSHLISLWAMDIMGDMSFSGGFETLSAGKDEEGWMDVLSIGVLAVGILGQVPWTRDIVAMLPQPGPIVTFQQFASQKVKNIRKDTSGVPSDILSIIQDDASGTYRLTEKEAAADAAFLVVAGWDTVSQASTSFFRYIVANKTIFARLRKELDEAFEGPVEDIDAFTLVKLPYLDACVQEALRMVPPVAAGPPRYSGRKGVQVLDRFIPPGTTVACPIYTLHRDPSNFSDPGVFQPERWMGLTNGVHNIEAYIPFSTGVGVCIGKQVALHNMKFLAASMIRTFDITFPDDFDVELFDASYKEHNLWLHDALVVSVKQRIATA